MTVMGTAIRSAVALVVFAISHSALASLPVKQQVRSVVGERHADGAYRFFFNGVAVVSLAAFLRYIWQLPDRRIYRVSGVPRAVMFLGQAICVVMLLWANYINGLGRVTGIQVLLDHLRGRAVIPPVAQHPLPDGDCLEGWTGPFRLSSHPNNYFVLLLYWLSPNMTVKWGSIGLLTSLYMVVGSYHEDYRLLRAYGSRYTCYRAEVPHLQFRPVWAWITLR